MCCVIAILKYLKTQDLELGAGVDMVIMIIYAECLTRKPCTADGTEFPLCSLKIPAVAHIFLTQVMGVWGGGRRQE